MFEEIASVYPPRDQVDLDHLADMVCTVIEGAIIMSRAADEPRVTSQQVLLLRSYIKLLFTPH